jgi:hypothetical protein
VHQVLGRRFPSERGACAKVFDSLVLLVSTAPELELLRGGAAAARERNQVVEFQKTRLGAPAFGALERTAAVIALPDSPPDRRRDMTASPSRKTRGTGRRRPRELRTFEVLEQKRQRAVEYRGRIAAGDCVAQQVLSPPKFVMGLAADGELHLVAFGRERADDRDLLR